MIKNKVVIVLGGAGLLGESFCVAIAKNRGVPIVADVNIEKAKFISRQVNNIYGCNSTFLHVDITSTESINELFNKVKNNYQEISAVVNNAYPKNKGYGADFHDVSYNNFCDNMSKNLGGAFLVMQQATKFFIKQGHGNIINISSIYGVTPPKFDIYEGTSMTMPVEYAAIKSALIHLTKYVAKYLKGKCIRVNAISPGGILQNQDEIFIKKYQNNCLNKGMLNQDDINGALLFLLSDLSKYINGQNIIVDDGFSL